MKTFTIIFSFMVIVLTLTACGKLEKEFSNDNVMNSKDVIEANRKETPLPLQATEAALIPTPDVTIKSIVNTPKKDTIHTGVIEPTVKSVSASTNKGFSNDNVMNSKEVLEANRKRTSIPTSTPVDEDKNKSKTDLKDQAGEIIQNYNDYHQESEFSNDDVMNSQKVIEANKKPQ